MARRADQVQADPPLLLEGHALGHIGLGAVLGVGGPLLGEVEAAVHQGLAARRHVGQEDAGLAVLDLAQPAALLAGHAAGLLALLGESRGIEHEHAVGVAQLVADVTAQLAEHGGIIPAYGADEQLPGAALESDLDGDGLGDLALQAGELALEDHLSVPALLEAIEAGK